MLWFLEWLGWSADTVEELRIRQGGGFREKRGQSKPQELAGPPEMAGQGQEVESEARVGSVTQGRGIRTSPDPREGERRGARAPQSLRLPGGVLPLRQGVQSQEAIPAGSTSILRHALQGCRMAGAAAGNQGGHV